MSKELNGSFSGLWTCELCGKTGTDCTCEHYDRGYAWGHDKTLSDAELSAEAYRQLVRACAKVGMASMIDGEDVQAAPLDSMADFVGKISEETLRVRVVNRFAILPDYREADDADIE